MRKQQIVLIITAVLLFTGLYFFGNTVAPNKPAPSASQTANASANLTTEMVIAKYRAALDTQQVQKLAVLDNTVVRGDVHEQQIHVYHQLASYWSDTLHNEIMGAYYAGEAAKLENSEKSLTFAAHLLLDDMMSATDASMQKWLATQSKSYLIRRLR